MQELSGQNEVGTRWLGTGRGATCPAGVSSRHPANDEISQALTARDRVVFAVLLVVIVGLYAPLHHRVWVLGGDGDLFLSVARSIALREGYRFNGQPVAIIPPGWPVLLAVALKLTTNISLLTLIPAACLIGFLATSFWILRRFTTALPAAVCVLVTALLWPSFSLAFLFYSDPLFALLAALSLWQAMRVNEGKKSVWRLGVLAMLCAASVSVRWTGMLWVLVVCAALVNGEWYPRLNRRWIAAILCIATTLGTFTLLRWWLRVDANAVDPRYDTFVAQPYDLLNIEPTARDQIGRLLHAGQWIGALFWFIGVDIRWTRQITNIAGWAVLLLMLITLIDAIRRKIWIGPAIFVYVAVLVSNWPDAIPRYLLPAAPLLLLGTYAGILNLCSRLPDQVKELRWVAEHYFFGSIILANLVLYGIEVKANRDPDPMSRLYAGYHKELVDAARWLQDQPRDGSEVAISSKLVNYGTPYFTDGFRRAMNLLTNRAIVTVPEQLCREPDAELIEWAVNNRVRYYLYQPPIELMRHFHRTGWHGRARDRETTQWRVYEIRDGRAERVFPPPTTDWPSHVPGM